jgi:hypothetical protein
LFKLEKINKSCEKLKKQKKIEFTKGCKKSWNFLGDFEQLNKKIEAANDPLTTSCGWEDGWVGRSMFHGLLSAIKILIFKN